MSLNPRSCDATRHAWTETLSLSERKVAAITNDFTTAMWRELQDMIAVKSFYVLFLSITICPSRNEELRTLANPIAISYAGR